MPNPTTPLNKVEWFHAQYRVKNSKFGVAWRNCAPQRASISEANDDLDDTKKFHMTMPRETLNGKVIPKTIQYRILHFVGQSTTMNEEEIPYEH